MLYNSLLNVLMCATLDTVLRLCDSESWGWCV